jgi:hypothetical protein
MTAQRVGGYLRALIQVVSFLIRRDDHSHRQVSISMSTVKALRAERTSNVETVLSQGIRPWMRMRETKARAL